MKKQWRVWGFDSTGQEIQFRKPKLYWRVTPAINAGIFRIKKTGDVGKLKKSFIKLQAEVFALSCRRLQPASDQVRRPLQHGRAGHVIIMATPWSHQLHPPAADDTLRVVSDQLVSRSPYHQYMERNHYV